MALTTIKVVNNKTGAPVPGITLVNIESFATNKIKQKVVSDNSGIALTDMVPGNVLMPIGSMYYFPLAGAILYTGASSYTIKMSPTGKVPPTTTPPTTTPPAGGYGPTVTAEGAKRFYLIGGVIALAAIYFISQDKPKRRRYVRRK